MARRGSRPMETTPMLSVNSRLVTVGDVGLPEVGTATDIREEAGNGIGGGISTTTSITTHTATLPLPDNSNTNHRFNNCRKHKGVQRLLSWNQFSSREMESLYQRYVFRIQQSALACILLLLTILCLSLAALTSLFVKGGYTLQGLYLFAQGLIFLAFFVCIKAGLMREQHFTGINYIVLSFVCVLALLSAPLPLLLENHLSWDTGGAAGDNNRKHYSDENYNVFGTSDGTGTTWSTYGETGSYLSGNEKKLAIGAANNGMTNGYQLQKQQSSDRLSNAADGAWVLAFIIFNVYALMPLRTLTKCLVGGILPGVHLAVASQTCSGIPHGPEWILWRQVRHFFCSVNTVNVMSKSDMCS
ncbi:Ca(2+)/calmodulin-responsive adenylate cyclase [Plakobranchus ocellatus]|uniref:Ca(2+)/calmodulin-responsive adenylate cyclase n=1 Tax=Plakobranchus ocellatus TaxID=259542 RepID=A0AAV4CY82_9GAST|nr:Ca(2+)/calmodulin-responsive adenylate cyclase [Plakobranchus ocellatus]